MVPQSNDIQDDMKVVYHYGGDHAADYVDRKFDLDTDPVSMVAAFVRNIDEHRAALSKLVAHPDRLQVIALPYSGQELQRIYGEISANMGDQETYYSVGLDFGAVTTQLHADKKATAAALHQKYGDALKITVGVRQYPAPACIADTCRPLPPETPQEGLEIRFKEPATVDAGKDGVATVIVRNAGATPVPWPNDVGLASVVERGTRRVVAAGPLSALAANAVLTTGSLAPGQQTEVAVSFGTANCAPTGDYALAPGAYGLLTVHGHGTAAPEFMYSDEGTLNVR
ncbi:MAG TPA: hypothetical protein VFB78_03280 [Acidimicrobiales bacterium]|nr:hypothetical protein [Acidimicrobiales bacterium]